MRRNRPKRSVAVDDLLFQCGAVCRLKESVSFIALMEHSLQHRTARFYRPKGSRYEEHYTQTVSRSGRSSVLVWSYNSHVHTRGVVKKWVENFCIRTLDWPRNAADANADDDTPWKISEDNGKCLLT
ncbi:hypothetical protein AVEN_253431-1 [Araneus ventricosus]|uniref:Uncharacterized protein n=1 Tax=Araneus ventricosus TaxID=182803 RepID=A0A4Y2HG78_ARAVE|nr:hypothetical protein AVEN_253431-1 [Araneus ventricosus]